LAFIGGTISLIISFVLAFLGAQNTAPWTWLSYFIKFGTAMIRSVPSLILALIVIASIGFGNTSAIFILGLVGIASLTRLFIGS
ncbi:phosphonate ABC transporter permease, partial [Aerococcus urinae]|nr:phosphonate ABC transporter permease [Aerococcus urinae]